MKVFILLLLSVLVLVECRVKTRSQTAKESTNENEAADQYQNRQQYNPTQRTTSYRQPNTRRNDGTANQGVQVSVQRESFSSHDRQPSPGANNQYQNRRQYNPTQRTTSYRQPNARRNDETANQGVQASVQRESFSSFNTQPPPGANDQGLYVSGQTSSITKSNGPGRYRYSNHQTMVRSYKKNGNVINISS